MTVRADSPLIAAFPSLPLPLLLLAFSGCIGGGGESGSESDATATATATSTGTSTGSASETDPMESDSEPSAGETEGGLVSTAGPEHCGTIVDDEVWAADLNPHVVTCDVQVEGGTLTIGPGTEVLFANNVGLWISEEGGTANLEVLGVADAPVSFAGEGGSAPGQWRGLGVFPAAGDVSLAHTTIDAAGGLNATAAVFVESTDLHIDHVTITNADDLGLDFRRHGRLTADSVGLAIHGTVGWPVQIDPNWVDTLPAIDSDYTGNDRDGIYIKSSGTDWRDVVRSAEWEVLGVDYYAIDSIRVEGEALEPAYLTLLDGVVVRFAETSGLGVSLEGGAAGLLTKGTAERPVTLTSLGANDRGAWAGVEIRDNADNGALRLENTIVEWAGGFNSVACVETEEVELFADGLTLRGCEKAGFVMRNGVWADGSAGLRVTDSDRVGEMNTPQAHTMPIAGVDLTGNDRDALSVVQPGAETITKAVTWRDIGVPYRVEDDIALEGTAQDPAVLTLEAGVVLAFTGQANLAVGRDGGASGLRALGTADASVVFTSAEAFDPGAWSGILIFDAAVDAETNLNYAEIRWAGGLNSESNVRIDDASPTISNSVIGGSDCWAIELFGDAAPTLTNNTYEDNTCGDVKP